MLAELVASSWSLPAEGRLPHPLDRFHEWFKCPWNDGAQLAGGPPSCTLEWLFLGRGFVLMSGVGLGQLKFRVLLLGIPLCVACGDPPDDDFHAAGSKTSGVGGNAGVTSSIATVGSSTSSNATTGNATSNESSNTGSSTSSGAGGTNAESTSTDGGSSTGGVNVESCDGLPTWDGGNPEFTLSEGEEIEHNGRRYRATQQITFPNAECAPDEPLEWCAGWFEDLGPC
jgi:hypothetical protein